MTSATIWLDVLRMLALIEIAIFMALLPFAIKIRPRGGEVNLLIICVEFAYISVAGSVISHFGDGIIWYLTPTQLVGATAGLAFIFQLDRYAQKHELEDRERYNIPTDEHEVVPRKPRK
jgi:hypothetical protein